MEEMIQQLTGVLSGRKYVIIGGIAASILGKPRTTLDADVVVMIPQDNVADLIEKFRLHGFKISESSIEKLINRLKRLLPVKVRFGKAFSVDVRVASYSIDKEAIKRAVSVQLFGKTLLIATPEDIIVYKMARFEDIDKADIKAIIDRHGRKLDTAYVKRTTHKLVEETGDNSINERLESVLSWMENK
jgi:Nucleotidyltransferase of unknown function (DUF6036)